MTRMPVPAMPLPASPPAGLAPPEHDPIYAAVMELRRPGILASRVRAAWARADATPPAIVDAAVVQTHYKPAVRARLVARARLDTGEGAPVTQMLHLQIYANAARAERAFARASTKPPLRCHGAPVALLDDHTVVWALPNGGKLRAAKLGMHRGKLVRFLTDCGLSPPGGGDLPELVRYVPRHRALFRYAPAGQQALYIKLYAAGGDAQGAANLALLGTAARDRLGFDVPRLVAHDPGRHALVMSEVPGERLTGLVATASPELFARVGRALAGLHGAALQPALRWTTEGELQALRCAMRDVETALPQIGEALRALIGRIETLHRRLPAGAETPVHGNLFGDQILIAADRVGIVDWDDLCRGDPLFDLGRLIAHLVYLAHEHGIDQTRMAPRLAALVGGCAGAPARAAMWTRLRWQIAIALLMRAKISALRPLGSGWIEKVAAMADEAERVLDDRSPWLCA